MPTYNVRGRIRVSRVCGFAAWVSFWTFFVLYQKGETMNSMMVFSAWFCFYIASCIKGLQEKGYFRAQKRRRG